MTIEYHRLAEKEIQGTVDYLTIHGMKPSSEFLREIQIVETALETNSAIGSPIYRRYRFMKLATYQYTVFYRQTVADHAIVYAVAHDNRRPGYWLKRARKK